VSGVARVSPGDPPVEWQVDVPGSKSLTNRALLVAAVADGTSRLANPLVADDTMVMRAALETLGVEVTEFDGGLRTTHPTGLAVLRDGRDRRPLPRGDARRRPGTFRA
jgi:5-enolpyruvylshikimate-3-phosphate synthase